ncbi:integrin alpha-PS1-like isoform X2 [Penaeus chinensis]|uniref:integrin alpha-PS1-like isoform X2 n=1 Tax=Penaeus chinensis TaxID=139456 RepID=UPI001FB6377B|nr:integrin alpha-PS1-like isoform X2 [Penaeus chinensis]
MAEPTRLFALLWCLCSLGQVLPFNLEPKIPIVKKGSPKSHFGYTVAQHQTILDTASGVPYKKSWILVGAPKDHNLQPGTNRSGALWRCPLTTRTTDCEQVQTDGFKNIDANLSMPAENEIKDDQWLGVTLKSQGAGGKVLVCAHRYMHKGPGFQWGFGLCYILTQTLDVSEYLEPCRGKPVNEGHQQYGFCQAGTSGLLINDEAVLGVPGPYTWRGTVHTSNISDNFLFKDKTQYFGPVTEKDSPMDKYSYLGYSVTAGRFFGNYMSYVGGAPRAKETGQVVFFTREKVGESLLRVDLILNGEMFASSFGFEVLAVDINNDGRDDLIVGAPFYYTSTSSGAVYVYMNNDGGFVEDHPYTKIEGEAGESRFGFSMTSLGDLNHDGYTDVAIGAPYEGRGAVYVYLGTKDGLMKEDGQVKVAQVIRAEDMPGVPYNAFGYSLSGGMDLDGNGYPDLLTSSFCSDRVLLIRARPIIDIQTKVQSQNNQLENIDPSKKGCIEDISSPETCFSFDACFKMDNDAGTKTVLRLKYTIEEQLYKDQPIARIRFSNGLQDRPYTVERDIKLRPEDMGIFQCSREIVYLLDGPRDILRPLKFKLSYEIIQGQPSPVPEGSPLPDIDEFPILNQQEAVRYFKGTFAKDCGEDDICVSDLNIKANLSLDLHESGRHYLLRLGEQNTVPLNVEVMNAGEPAYQSSLLVHHHKALELNLKESQLGSYQCSRVSAILTQCGLGNPLVGTTGPLILTFKESNLPFDEKFIHFYVEANSSSTEERSKDRIQFVVEVIKRAEISILPSVAPEQVFYGGEVVGQSAINHMEEVGMEVTHKYVVDNRGPWRVDEAKVAILWPYQVENNKEQGKWLLYMTEVPSVDGAGECEVDSRYVNPLVLRRTIASASTGLEVEGELISTDYPDPGGDIVTGSGDVKVTKKVTTIKKVTSTTDTKKTSTKSSSKDVSVSTERTTSSSGYSSSSSSSSNRFSSSTSEFSNSGSTDEEEYGSGFGQGTGRDHGRTHVRVSRKVFTSDRSKFSDSDSGANDLDKEKDVDGDGLISHHEETRTSSGVSPDGRTRFSETHHVNKKVHIKESTTDEDLPAGRWGQGGGFRKIYTETSRSGSSSIPSEEDRRIFSETEGSSRVGIDDHAGSGWHDGSAGRDHSVQVEDGSHRVQTVNRDETIRRTHYGGPDRDGSYRRVYEETRTTGHGRVGTHTGGYDDTYDRDGFRTQTFGRHDRVGADRTEGSGWSRGSRTEYERRTGGTDESRRVGDRDRFNTDGSRRVSEGDRVRWTYADNQGRTTGRGSTGTYSSSRGYESERTFSGDYDRTDDGSHRRTYSGAYDRTGIDSRRGHSGGYDRTAEEDGSRTYFAGYDRIGDNDQNRRVYGRTEGESEYRKNFDNYDRRINAGGRDESSVYERTESTRTYHSSRNEDGDFRDGSSRSSGDQYYRRTNLDRSSDHASGTDSFRHASGEGRVDGSHSKSGHGTLRTTTWDLTADSDRHNRARQGSHSSHHHVTSAQDHGTLASGSGTGRTSHFESSDSNANRTYKRVEVDPETGETTVYTRRVYSHSWPEDWDHRSFDEDLPPLEEEEHKGSDRQLKRTKRERELIIKPQAVTDAKTGKTMQVVNLRCDGDVPTAKCFVFYCTIRNLGAKQAASIRIKSRLWNSTLVEDYPRVSYVSIKSKASLILPEDIREDQDQSDDEASAETLAYPDLLDQLPPEEVPLWVILVSIFAGLLVLLIIALILWKLGFFERKRPDPTLSGNLDKDANGY